MQEKPAKPVFLRQKWQHRKNVPVKWRRPKGLHSKMRENRKGHPPSVHPGYGLPGGLRGLHFSGKKLFRIFHESKLDELDPKDSLIIIDSRIGWKRREGLMLKAIEKGFAILNFRDPKKRILEIKEKRGLAKKASEASKKGKEKKADAKQEKQKAAEQKGPETEEPKDAEKKEQDKILTKRQA